MERYGNDVLDAQVTHLCDVVLRAMRLIECAGATWSTDDVIENADTAAGRHVFEPDLIRMV